MPDCSVLVNFAAERQRMCDSFTYPSGKHNCEKCGLDALTEKIMSYKITRRNCERACLNYPDKAAEIVQKWSDEHGIVTRKSWFLKHFPNAALEDNGYPSACAGDVFGFGCTEKNKSNCRLCWAERYEEGEVEA